MALNPDIVEKGVADISVKDGLNESERPEAVDWTKWLTVADNVSWAERGALVKRPGITPYYTGEFGYPPASPMGLMATGEGLVAFGEAQKDLGGIGAYSVVESDSSGAFQPLVGAGYMPEFSLVRRTDVAALTSLTLKHITFCCQTSKFNIIGIRDGDRHTVLIVERLSGYTVSRLIVPVTSSVAQTQLYGCTMETATNHRLLLVRQGASTTDAEPEVSSLSLATVPSGGNWDTFGSAWAKLGAPATSAHLPVIVGVEAVGDKFFVVQGPSSSGSSTDTYVDSVDPDGTPDATSTISTFECHGCATDRVNLFLSGNNTSTSKVCVKRVSTALAVTHTVDATESSAESVRIAASSGLDAFGLGLVVYRRAATNTGSTHIANTEFQLAAKGGAISDVHARVAGFAEVSAPYFHEATGRFYVNLAKQISSSSGTSLEHETVSGLCFAVDFTLAIPRPAASIGSYTTDLSGHDAEYGFRLRTAFGNNAPSAPPRVPTDNRSALFAHAYVSGPGTTSFAMAEHAVTPVSTSDSMASGGLPGYHDGMVVRTMGITDVPLVFLKAVAPSGAGIPPGLYTYVAVYEVRDGLGRTMFSGTSRPSTVVFGSAQDVEVQVAMPFLGVEPLEASVSLYRTLSGGKVLYRLTGFTIEPASAGSVFATLYVDQQLDSVIESNPQPMRQPLVQGAALQRFAPLASRHTIRHKDRVFYCNGQQVYYSSFDLEGEAPWFNPSFSFAVPGGAGDITALASMDGLLIIFKRNAVFLVDGDGPPENGGSGAEFSPPRRLNTEFGCVDPRSIVYLPDGVAYRSERGIELLNRSLQVKDPSLGDFVRQTVEANPHTGGSCFDRTNGRALWVIGPDVAEDGGLTSSVILTLDITAKAWSVWRPDASLGVLQTVAYADLAVDGKEASRVVYASEEGICYEDHTTHLDAGAYVPMRVETGWVRMQSMQDRLLFTDMYVLAQKTSGIGGDNHGLKLQVAYDYDQSYGFSKVFTADRMLAKGVEQFQWQLPRQNGQSVRFKLEDESPNDPANYPVNTGAGPKIIGITVRLGKQGTGAQLPKGAR
jgi:hypothetical protein